MMSNTAIKTTCQNFQALDADALIEATAKIKNIDPLGSPAHFWCSRAGGQRLVKMLKPHLKYTADDFPNVKAGFVGKMFGMEIEEHPYMADDKVMVTNGRREVIAIIDLGRDE